MEIKNSSIIIGLILVVALPASTSLIAYQITKDPTLLPLARTEDDEAIYKGTMASNRIVAKIRWTTGRAKNFTQDDVRTAISRAFNAHGVKVYVQFEVVDTNDKVSVTYVIGRNTIGPHPITRAADSINGAIAAYRMYKMVAPKPTG